MNLKYICILGLALAGCSAQTQLDSNNIQDSQKAYAYFQNELEYTTNPAGVKKAALDATSKIVIVDVRTEDAYKTGHIPRAINLPFKKYNSFEGNETEFPGLRKDAYNYVYCYESGCNLGQKAAKKFASLGYPVREVVGGYASWKDHKYPIEK